MKKNKVTVVEDEDDLRKLIQLILITKGFQVTGFSAGSDVAIRGHDAHVYIIDLNLKDMSGLDLCKAIKREVSGQDRPPIVIMISANPDLVTLATEACADDTLAKPFTANDLIEKVAKYLPI
jgi:DNA-binding response OmpR family regulator